MDFEDKIAIVTGAGSGIGRATALALAREGARVAIADRDADGAQATAQLIGRPDRTLSITTDVTREADVADMVAHVLRAWGRVDVAHNHAGMLHASDASILDIDEATLDETLAVNVKGQALVGKHVGRAMLGTGGAIVNTASDLSFVALPGVCAYVTSKAAIAGLTRAMAVDLAAHHIRVNAVCPGFVYTGMTAGLADNAEVMEGMRQAYLIKALGQPEDVAEAVLYLLSPRARFITGSLLVVDGGHLVQ